MTGRLLLTVSQANRDLVQAASSLLGWQKVDPNLRSEIRCLSVTVKGGVETNAASCLHGCISKTVGKFLNNVAPIEPTRLLR